MPDNLEDNLKGKAYLAQLNDDMLDATLKATYFRQACPDAGQLGNLIFDLLSEEEATQVRAHLAQCPYCPAEFEALQSFAQQEWQAFNGIKWQLQEAGRLVIRLVDELLTPLSPQQSSLAVRSGAKQKKDGSDSSNKQVIRRIILGMDEVDDFDIEATVFQIMTEDQPSETCFIEMHVEQPSRWPKLSGIRVQVSANDWQRTGQTDDAGNLVFQDLPLALVEQLVITITP